MDRSALLKEFEFEDEEVTEILAGQHGKTGFPKPIKSYKLFYEVSELSLEEPYFWVLDMMKTSFPMVDKLEDSFAAAENSAFFGASQQRLGAQQDKVSSFLAATGKMIKELFQMVRELRIIDERLTYYKGSDKQLSKEINQRHKGPEVTLKGYFVDLVQGGGKSAASVYGMAQQLEFVTLPDLFFDAPPFKNQQEIEKHISNLGKDFNHNVLRVLLRHLTQFTQWKEQTFKEHKNRRKFMLSYLLQHFEIIKMYVNWVKPYLRNVSKLSLKQKNMNSPDLVAAFEGSMIDVELLGRIRKPVGEKKGANGCLLVTFQYRTRPDLKIHNEYQRGAVHVGRFEMQLRAYTWTDDQVEAYKNLKDKEIMSLIGDVSSTVEQAMNSLGKELDNYIKEAKDSVEGKKEVEMEEKPKKTFMETFFGDFYTPKSKKAMPTPNKRNLMKEKAEMDAALSSLKGAAKGASWAVYNYFKKSHRMVTW
jgi:hypothetical protein